MQTSYSSPAAGRAGYVQSLARSIALLNGEASAAIPFGRFAQLVSGKAKILTGGSNALAGVVAYSDAYDRLTQLDATADGPKAGVLMDVITSGIVAVLTEEDVTAEVDRVHVRHTTGVGALGIGVARKSAVAGETMDITNQARFVRTTSAGGIALVEFNLLVAPAYPYFGTPVVTVGAEASNHIDVSIQMPRAAVQALRWYVSAAAPKGSAVVTTAPDGGTAVQAGTALVEWTAEKIGMSLTDATGLLTLRLTESSTGTFYVHFIAEDGQVYVSGAITFA